MKRNRLKTKSVLLSVLAVLLIRALFLSQVDFCLAASNPIEEESQRTALKIQNKNNENISHISSLPKDSKELDEAIRVYGFNITGAKIIIGMVSINQSKEMRSIHYVAEESRAPPKHHNQFCSLCNNPNCVDANSSGFLSAKNSGVKDQC